MFKEEEPKSEEESFDRKKEEEEEIPLPDRLETISTNDKESSGSEYNDSDTHSGLLDPDIDKPRLQFAIAARQAIHSYRNLTIEIGIGRHLTMLG